MAEDEIKTLDDAIDKLNARWNELDVYLAPSLEAKREVLDQMDLISIRITWLETTRNHIRAALVTIDPPNDADTRQITDALNSLSKQIAKDMEWKAALDLVKGILSAATTIKTNIDGRQRKANP